MDIINSIIGVPLGYLCFLSYELISNYGIAILIFTVMTKILLFPISYISQKNSIKMVKIQPMLDDLKMRYSGNANLFMAEQKKLFKKEKYSTIINILPLLLQIPIVLGVINVMYNPLQHILKIEQYEIHQMELTTKSIIGSEAELGFGSHLTVIKTVQEFPERFSAVNQETIDKVLAFDVNFMGIDLAAFPSFDSFLLIIPILSALSALIMCIAQNKLNVLQREQGFFGKWGVAAFLVAFSGYFAYVVPCGIGVYWIYGNFLSILVMVICNLLYDPKKYIDYKNRSVKVKLTAVQKKELKKEKSIRRVKEKADVKRFMAIKDKQLVFYSESNGFYKYFDGIIDYVTKNSDLTVHYITSDYNDKIFNTENKQIEPYYCAGNALIPLMMKIDADMVVMTMPDLGQYHIKRSLVRKDAEYVFLDHGMTSLHMMFRKGALDNFNTIFCYGPNHVNEVRETEKLYNLPEKRVVKTGYGLLDKLLTNVAAMGETKNEVKRILIAPSWQNDNIMELCLDETIQPLIGLGYCIIVRPHPEFVKRFPDKMNKIIEKYKNITGENFIIETDFSSNVTVFTSDMVITDWSSIAQEFSYSTKKPSIFINTPMKVMNPEYMLIPSKPLDITLRDQIGVSVDVENLSTLGDIAADLFAKSDYYKEKITQVLYDNIYNIGKSDRVAGEYIIGRLIAKVKTDEANNSDINQVWMEYMSEDFERLKSADEELKLITLNDKIAELRLIDNQYESIGNEVWQLFGTKDKNSREWLYRRYAEVFTALSDEEKFAAGVAELEALIAKIFK